MNSYASHSVLFRGKGPMACSCHDKDEDHFLFFGGDKRFESDYYLIFVMKLRQRCVFWRSIF